MRVAVAIIRDDQQRVLITQRPLQLSHGGLWEFPGGKLEDHESKETALIREVQEEVGLQVLDYSYIGSIDHQYSDKTVQLLVFHVTQFMGRARCLEGQLDMKWVMARDLKLYSFPEANLQILHWLKTEKSLMSLDRSP